MASSDGPPGESERDAILESIPLHSSNLLTVLDESGTIRYESPAIERIFGFDQDALIGQPVAQYFHPEERERVLEAFRTLTESTTHTVESVEYRHERADGSWCWVESVGSSEPTPPGPNRGKNRDITDHRRREHELRRQNERLEDFAHVVSHDLRNPLNVAHARLSMARETEADEHLEAAERSLERMETLIEDLLTLATNADSVDDREPVSLRTTITQCWERVPSSEATLDVETDATVVADESRLAQLFENLLRNAVEHSSMSPDSQARQDAVEHSSRNSRSASPHEDAVEHAGNDVKITVGDLEDGFYVEDDGPGIPEADRERVFEVGVSTAPSGTGLGLSIVDTVAHAHGWNVEIFDGANGGARFEFTGVDRSE